MGAWGEQTRWEIDRRLPDIPPTPLAAEDVERVALARSLDLSTARQRIIGGGPAAGIQPRDRADS